MIGLVDGNNIFMVEVAKEKQTFPILSLFFKGVIFLLLTFLVKNE